MSKRLDAIILAGTQGCEPLEIDGRRDYKQFLPLGNKAIAQYVIEAALECSDINRVYVVSDINRMNQVLPLDITSHNKFNLTHDRGSFVQNIKEVFFEEMLENAGYPEYESYKEKHYKDAFTPNAYRKVYSEQNPTAAEHQVVLLYSDTPFICANDISRFVATSENADLVIGFADAPAVMQLEQTTGVRVSDPMMKTGLFPLEDTDVRFNNISLVKPLRVPIQVWDLVQNIYERRYLLDDKGNKNTGNWKSIVKTGWEYTKSFDSGFSVMRGFLKAATSFLALYYAIRRKSALPRLFLDRTDFENAIHLLSDKQMTASINISDVVHPILDIDNARMYTRLCADNARLFENLYYSQRKYGNDISQMTPEMELKRLLLNAPHLFRGVPEANIVQNLYKRANPEKPYA